ncbi:MAG: sigma-70 family RNA polymerase sigma factor [Nitriliruptor sp.]|nr:MAG: sigma-70 family RNA polymerase sigma factor [Nitriliruptor sp.]
MTTTTVRARTGTQTDSVAHVTDDPTDARFREQVLPELEVLYRVARRLTGSNSDAEDLVQDTLLKAFRAFDRFDGRYLRAWLLTIMRNHHRNQLRKRRPDLLDDEVAQRLPGHGQDARRDGVDERAFHDDLDPVVREALKSLSPKHRSVIALVDLDGLTYREAAELLGVPVGTVMSRLHRARSKVRSRLEAHLDVEDTS